MDHEKLVEEVQRLQDWLAQHDPASEGYETVLCRLIKLTKLGIEFDEACDKQCERQDRLQMDEEKTAKDYDLKVRELDIRERELEQKSRIDDLKLEESAADIATRRRIEKRQAWWDLIKIGLTTGCSAALIVFTGKTEQHAILGQHQWSLIPKMKG